MFDRLLNSLLWVVVMSLIASTAIAGLILSYRGILHFCSGRLPSGASAIGAGAVLAFFSYLLCRHGNDLMDR
jgi:hypothetical protein